MISIKKSLKVIGLSLAQTARCIRIVDPSPISWVDEKAETNAVKDFKQQVVSFLQVEKKSWIQGWIDYIFCCSRPAEEEWDFDMYSLRQRAIDRKLSYTNSQHYLENNKSDRPDMSKYYLVKNIVNIIEFAIELQTDIISVAQELIDLEEQYNKLPILDASYSTESLSIKYYMESVKKRWEEKKPNLKVVNYEGLPELDQKDIKLDLEILPYLENTIIKKVAKYLEFFDGWDEGENHMDPEEEFHARPLKTLDRKF